jgi:Ca2+-transporting ATPase
MIGWLNGEVIKHAVNVHLACRGRHSEALPALVTIAFGAKRLAKVMHLYENSGGGNTWISYHICTDKTGTLTENKMTVKEVYLTPDVKPKPILVKRMPLTAMVLNSDVSEKKAGLAWIQLRLHW